MLAQSEVGNEINMENKSKKMSLVGAFLIILGLMSYVLLVSPLLEKKSVMEANISTKSAEVSQIDSQIKAYKESEDKLQLTTEVQRWEVLNAVPTEMYQDKVIEDVINIADTYDIQLNAISFSRGGSSENDVQSLVVNASFVGNYSDLTDFLEGLEQNSRIFKVNSISVQIGKLDISKLERANFSLTIETFFQK